MDFGAFVTISPGKDGLVHVSQISNERVEKVSDKLKEGDIVKVKVLEVDKQGRIRSEEHTSELQSLMRISYAVFCLKKKKIKNTQNNTISTCPNLSQPKYI